MTTLIFLYGLWGIFKSDDFDLCKLSVYNYTSLCPGLSVSVASVGWWVGTILSGEISPFLLSSRMGTAGTLLLHAVICALSFIFVLLFLPETKVKLWHLCAIYVHILIELFFWSYYIYTTCMLKKLPLQSSLLVSLFVCILQQLSLEQVDRLFSTPWLERTNPLYYLTYVYYQYLEDLFTTVMLLEWHRARLKEPKQKWWRGELLGPRPLLVTHPRSPPTT